MAPFDFATLPRLHHNGPVVEGMSITATRIDGRLFAGKVVKVVATEKDTLVTVVRENNTYRSFYLNDTTGWTTRNA